MDRCGLQCMMTKAMTHCKDRKIHNNKWSAAPVPVAAQRWGQWRQWQLKQRRQPVVCDVSRLNCTVQTYFWRTRHKARRKTCIKGQTTESDLGKYWGGVLPHQRLSTGLLVLCRTVHSYTIPLELMESLEYVQAYLYDLLYISRKSLEDHLEKLDKILRRLRVAGLKVNILCTWNRIPAGAGVCMLVPKLEWTPYRFWDSPIWNIDKSLPIPIRGSPFWYGVPFLNAVPIWGQNPKVPNWNKPQTDSG